MENNSKLEDVWDFSQKHFKVKRKDKEKFLAMICSIGLDCSNDAKVWEEFYNFKQKTFDNFEKIHKVKE
jgi:hypothetical protein